MIIRNTRREPRVCRLQNQNSIVTPPPALNAIVAQRGANVGIIQVSEKRKSWRYGSRSARPASIADGIPPAAETGEPVPLFGLQVKGWRHLRPPFHIGRAVPAEMSENAEIGNWGQKLKVRKILGSKDEKSSRQRLYIGKYGWCQRAKAWRCDQSQSIFLN